MAATTKSSRELFSEIQTIVSTNRDDLIDKILTEDVIRKVSLGLLHYKQVPQGQTKDDLSRAKWGGNTAITNLLRQELIEILASKLNLDLFVAFELIDVYFKFHPSDYTYLTTLEAKYQYMSNQINQFLQTNPAQQFLHQRQAFDKLQAEVSKTLQKVQSDVQMFFFRERQSLLDTIALIIHGAHNNAKLGKILIDKIINTNHLDENLVTSLENNLEERPISLDYSKEIIFNMQAEEIKILSILFSIFPRFKIPDINIIHKFYMYVSNTDFEGFMSRHHQIMYQISNDPQIQIQKDTISDLNLLTILNMFQLQLFTERNLKASLDAKNFIKGLVSNPQKFKEMHKKIISCSTSTRNAVLFLCYIQITDFIKGFKLVENPDAIQILNETKPSGESIRKLTSVHFVSHVQEMLGDHLFRSDDFLDKKSDFSLLIKNWLSIVYIFLKQNRIEKEQLEVQLLTQRIIRDPAILRQVWQSLDKEEHLGNEGSITLDMFDYIFQDPAENFEEFIKLMVTLCGNKYDKFGNKVVSFMENLQIQELRRGIAKDSGASYQALSYILKRLTINLEELEVQYKELNQQFLYLLDASNQDESREQDDFAKEDQIKNEPLLNILIRTLHALFPLNYEQSKYGIKQLTEAITSIFKSLNLKNEIIQQLRECITLQGHTKINEFFRYCADNIESKSNNYKGTEAYLKFLSAVFKQEFPQNCLPPHDRINLDQSFLSEGLSMIYQNLMHNYYQFEFTKLKDFADFSIRLFKLTRILLSKFRDIPHQLKAPLHQAFPRFDFLLSIIMNTLNSLNIEELLFSALDLKEGEMYAQHHQVTSRFWLLAIGSKSNNAKMRVKFNNLISESLKCLNLLLQLSLLNHQSYTLSELQSKEMSQRQFYIQNLNCVQRMTQAVLDPSSSIKFIGTRYQSSIPHMTILNQISYYIKPHPQMCPKTSQLQILSIKFITLCSQVWAPQNEKKRTSLHLHLTNNVINAEEVKMKFLATFVECLNEIQYSSSVEWLVSFFDLLIISAQTQHSFVELMFRDSPQYFEDRILLFLKDVNIAKIPNRIKTKKGLSLYKQLCAKIVIFLSMLSTQRIHHDFIKKLTNNQGLQDIHEKIINEIFMKNLQQSVDINLRREHSSDIEQQMIYLTTNQNILNKFADVCQANVAIYYYMRFLQSEFSKDPSNKHVRRTITQLFNSKPVIEHKRLMTIESQYQELLEINECLKLDIRERNLDMQGAINQQVLSSGYQGSEQIQQNSTLATDGSVFLSKIEASESFKYLQTVQPYMLLITDYEENLKDLGKLGAQFVINTDELYYTCQLQCYFNDNLVAEAKRVAQNFNLAMSYMHVVYLFTKAKKDFIISIGKSRMRENMRIRPKIQSELVLNTSLLTLITDEEFMIDIGQSSQKLHPYQNQLTSLFIQIAKSIYDEIISAQALPEKVVLISAPRNYYLIKQAEIEIDFLSIVLAGINSLTSLGDIKIDNLTELNNLIHLKLINNITQILKQQLALIYKGQRETSQIKGMLVESEEVAAYLYTQLIQQIFQLALVCKATKPKRVGPPSMILQEEKTYQQLQEQTERAYLTIISQVINLMSKGYCFEQGLKILQQSVHLLDPANLSLFMKKQDNNALRMIIQKLIGQTTTAETSIQILEFLTSYASFEHGAKHLYQESILHSISKNASLCLVNQQDLYIATGEAKRNPVHILWCWALVFLRTMNEHLINNSEYIRGVIKYLRQIEMRITRVLDIGRDLDSTGNPAQNILSLALLEEIELLTSVFLQLFNKADIWASVNFTQYAIILDIYQFSIPQLFSHRKVVIPSSSTEQYMDSIFLDQQQNDISKLQQTKDSDTYNPSALELRVDATMAKIFINVTSSMLNALILDKQGLENDLFSIWTSQKYQQQQPSYTNQSQSQVTYDQLYQKTDLDSDSFLQNSFEEFFKALESQIMNFKQWNEFQTTVQKVFDQSTDLYNFDEWTMHEYGGLGQIFGSQNFKQIFEILQVSIQMGNQVACLILEKLRDTYVDYYGRQDFRESRVLTMGKKLQHLINKFTQDKQIFQNAGKEGQVGAEFSEKLMVFLDIVIDDMQGKSQI